MRGSIIKEIKCRQVFGDRDMPAVEALVITKSGAIGRAVCTAGVSTGTHEVQFLYDGGLQWEGKGVTGAACYAQEKLGKVLLGIDAAKQREADRTLLDYMADHPNEPYAGNATAALSAAVLKAGAHAKGMQLYRHIEEIFNRDQSIVLPLASWGCFYGGSRYIPSGKQGVKPTVSFIAYDFESFHEATLALHDVVKAWDRLVFDKWGLRAACGRGSSMNGGFVQFPGGIVSSDEEIWEAANNTISKCGFFGRIGLQCDIAADSYYEKNTGLYKGIFSEAPKDRKAMINMAVRMAELFNFIVIEDPLHEEDFEGHAIVREITGIQIVGDDLFATNTVRVRKGVEIGAANAVLMKVNQVGTISDALDMAEVAYEAGYGVMPCNSRGEGIDIADYSVGINAATIRESCLGPTGGRLREIECELGKRAVFQGIKGLKGRKFAL